MVKSSAARTLNLRQSSSPTSKQNQGSSRIFLRFRWYGLKVDKQKNCRPPQHIGEKIGGQYVKMYVENHAL